MRVFAVPLIAFGMLTSGYIDEPTEGQMKRAFEASLASQVRDVLAFVTEVNGSEAVDTLRQTGSDRFAIRSFRKLDCTRISAEPAYICAFAIDIELMNGDLQRRMSGRFFRSPQGLAFADEV
jgi:hypothetical protein